MRGRQLLHHAAACGASAVISWLGTKYTTQLPLDGRDRKGRTPLRIATLHSQQAACEALLALGASPMIDAHEALAETAVSEDVRMLIGTAIYEWGRGRSALLLAAASTNDVRALQALHVDQGGDLLHCDERGYTALHRAAAMGHEAAILYLLQTPEAEQLCRASTADSGATASWTAVQLAAAPKVREMLEAFLAGGAPRARLIAQARRQLFPQFSTVGLMQGESPATES